MPTHDPSHQRENNQPGYEITDANFGGVLTFVIVLFASVGVFFVVCFGMGKLINEALVRHDGPLNTWSQKAGVKHSNMASDPAIQQQQLRALTSNFPTPRLQTDDGNQDISEMHAREDLLLDHYTWVDQKAQTVRIPIARAMQIIAQQGLPVVDQPAAQTAMVGDADTSVVMPLTNGFARTGPELIQIKERNQRMALDRQTSEPAK